MSGAKNVGVVVVDMQQSFLDDVLESEELIRAQQDMLIRVSGHAPIIVLEYSGYGPTIDEIKPYASLPPIVKRWDDGFCKTNLKETLSHLGVKTIILAGVYRGHCVFETAQGAIHAGFNVSTANTLMDGFEPWSNLERDFYRNRTAFYGHHDELLRSVL